MPKGADGGARAEALWKEVLLLAVGEQFADVIQPRTPLPFPLPSKGVRTGPSCTDTYGIGDDLCGLSFHVRYNSNLICVWNRDGAAQGTIDGILKVVLEKVSPELRPKEGSYYYKRHAEHQGFAEALARAQEREAAASKTASEEKERAEKEKEKGGESDEEGKIMEAKVTEGEVEKAEAEEEAEEMAEMQKAGMAPVAQGGGGA